MPPALIAVAAFAAFVRIVRTKAVQTAALTLLWALTSSGPAQGQTPAPRPQGLPQVNLLVSWRVDTAGSERGQQSVVSGQVILDSRGAVVGRTGLGATTVQTETADEGGLTQTLQVLNGRQARLFVGRQVGRQSWQLQWSPQGTAATGTSTGINSGAYGIQTQTIWVDLGDGLTVRPRWAGGRQPVRLDVDARSSRASGTNPVATSGFEPDGQVSRTEVATTLALPLDQWTLLARSGKASVGGSQAGLSTRSLDQQDTQTLWVRVSLATPGAGPSATSPHP